MLKKTFYLLLIIFILCGCKSEIPVEEITFSSWGSITEVQILKGIISDFEKENPNIKVNFIHIPQNYFQKIHLLFASNTAPDVIFMNNLYLPLYESMLEDLSDFIDKKSFYKQTIDGMSYNGKIYGVPRDISSLVLYINLEKMDLPDKNWDLNDLLDVAKKQTTQKTFGIGCEDEIYWLTPYLSYFGGGILDDSSKLIIHSEESKKAIKFYQDLVYKYKVAPTKSQIGSSTLAQMFLDEKIAMYLSGRWIFPKIKDNTNFNWAIINFPYGKSLQLCDTSGWVISKNSKHKESAKKFLEYLSREESYRYFTETGLLVPANIKASQVLNNDLYNQKVFLEVIKKSKKTPINKNYKMLTDKIDGNIMNIQARR